LVAERAKRRIPRGFNTVPKYIPRATAKTLTDIPTPGPGFILESSERFGPATATVTATVTAKRTRSKQTNSGRIDKSVLCARCNPGDARATRVTNNIGHRVCRVRRDVRNRVRETRQIHRIGTVERLTATDATGRDRAAKSRDLGAKSRQIDRGSATFSRIRFVTATGPETSKVGDARRFRRAKRRDRGETNIGSGRH
jgi:hypothetical protein